MYFLESFFKKDIAEIAKISTLIFKLCSFDIIFINESITAKVEVKIFLYY